MKKECVGRIMFTEYAWETLAVSTSAWDSSSFFYIIIFHLIFLGTTARSLKDKLDILDILLLAYIEKMVTQETMAKYLFFRINNWSVIDIQFYEVAGVHIVIQESYTLFIAHQEKCCHPSVTIKYYNIIDYILYAMLLNPLTYSFYNDVWPLIPWPTTTSGNHHFVLLRVCSFVCFENIYF